MLTFIKSLKVFLALFLLTGLCLSSYAIEAPLSITDEAQNLYRHFQGGILQVRVIETKTNKKSSIGSGFYIAAKGLIATNFHVVADVVHEPQDYHLEYLDYSGNKGLLELVTIDVVHDLAIVRSDKTAENVLTLSRQTLPQGVRLYSFGNPHDLGLTVVEGTYNGLLEKSRFEKIHFSGSLNPGMSGGPTLNRDGEVMGVNVSTAGNQISFLIPVAFLQTLVDKVTTESTGFQSDFVQLIEQQLTNDQQQFFSQLLSSDWKTDRLGDFSLPEEISSQFKCWGESDNDEDRLIDHSTTQCSTEDNIYVSSRFSMGDVFYSFELVENRDLLPVHFYALYQKYFVSRSTRNQGSEKFVSNYQCHSDFIDVANHSWRATTCARRYKKYPSLYDVVFNMAMVSENNKGLIASVLVSGISQNNSNAFIKHFLEHISWQK